MQLNYVAGLHDGTYLGHLGPQVHVRFWTRSGIWPKEAEGPLAQSPPSLSFDPFSMLLEEPMISRVWSCATLRDGVSDLYVFWTYIASNRTDHFTKRNPKPRVFPQKHRLFLWVLRFCWFLIQGIYIYNYIYTIYIYIHRYIWVCNGNSYSNGWFRGTSISGNLHIFAATAFHRGAIHLRRWSRWTWRENSRRSHLSTWKCDGQLGFTMLNGI